MKKKRKLEFMQLSCVLTATFYASTLYRKRCSSYPMERQPLKGSNESSTVIELFYESF
jgi:hypothetical protein